MSQQRMTYKKAGVDIHKADTFLDAIHPLIQKTHRPGVASDIGGFSGLFRVPTGMKKPLMVASTDGVGTKLLLAQAQKNHSTIGIDLVAMCVNDVIVCGAEPLLFLDYYATGHLTLAQSKDIIKGITTGCRDAGCALIGGETAEMPGLYKKHDYDLAGFCVGIVDESRIINGTTIAPGDYVVGLPSTGVHSNGFSLVRKLFSKKELAGTWGKTLLTPTKIYVKPFLALHKARLIKGAAHITGGGFYDNIPRCLPKGAGAAVNKNCWHIPPVFQEMQKRSKANDRTMFHTFNMGIGMVLIISPRDMKKVETRLIPYGIQPTRIGTIVKGNQTVDIL